MKTLKKIAVITYIIIGSVLPSLLTVMIHLDYQSKGYTWDSMQIAFMSILIMAGLTASILVWESNKYLFKK